MELASPSKIIVKILFVMATISFLWLGTFGLLHSMGKMGVGNTASSGCIFDGPSEVCTMNFSEHIAFFEELSTNLPGNAKLIELLVMTLALVVGLLLGLRSMRGSVERLILKLKLYLEHNHRVRLFDYLLREFREGILNPKIYAIATI